MNLLVADLRADYEDMNNGVDYYQSPATLRLMSAMPAMLDALEKAIAWRDDGTTTFTYYALCDALDDWA